MPTTIRFGIQKIDVDADWTLKELLTIGETYEQLYNVLYPLQPELAESLRGDGTERVEYLYRAFPWRGGYSAVNFYKSQGYLVPFPARPVIRRIRIESPGLIELGVAIAAAYSVERLVRSATHSASLLANMYHDIYRQMHERKLMRISAKREELALARDQLAFAAAAAQQFGDALELSEAKDIRRLADNPLAALKILLSIYRRARKLSTAEDQGKLKLEPPSPDRR